MLLKKPGKKKEAKPVWAVAGMNGQAKAEKISIVIPAYNEERVISGTLSAYHKFFSGAGADFELIVVSNNCSDSTPELAKKFSRGRRSVLCLSLPYYTGKGGAVLEGMKKASGGVVCFADADGSTGPRDIMMLAQVVRQGCDAAVGSRAVKGSIITKWQPLPRRALGFFFRSIVDLLFGLGIRDTQCGAKAFSRRAVDLFTGSNIAKGFEFDVQLLWICKRNGLSINEVGVKWENGADSKVGALDPLRMLAGLVRLRLISGR